ncbi:hypothetical protein DFR68_11234 [Nocardia mexicana]|uniref:Uncharacterized protein n=1 Tax=Nocardia mexicana TaxID=279262 RepID=A0A370GW35_9NOCA|nr:hypothetical protein DFR68_11234 [Nocardia mexicana]
MGCREHSLPCWVGRCAPARRVQGRGGPRPGAVRFCRSRPRVRLRAQGPRPGAPVPRSEPARHRLADAVLPRCARSRHRAVPPGRRGPPCAHPARKVRIDPPARVIRRLGPQGDPVYPHEDVNRHRGPRKDAVHRVSMTNSAPRTLGWAEIRSHRCPDGSPAPRNVHRVRVSATNSAATVLGRVATRSHRWPRGSPIPRDVHRVPPAWHRRGDARSDPNAAPGSPTAPGSGTASGTRAASTVRPRWNSGPAATLSRRPAIRRRIPASPTEARCAHRVPSPSRRGRAGLARPPGVRRPPDGRPASPCRRRRPDPVAALHRRRPARRCHGAPHPHRHDALHPHDRGAPHPHRHDALRPHDRGALHHHHRDPHRCRHATCRARHRRGAPCLHHRDPHRCRHATCWTRRRHGSPLRPRRAVRPASHCRAGSRLRAPPRAGYCPRLRQGRGMSQRGRRSPRVAGSHSTRHHRAVLRRCPQPRAAAEPHRNPRLPAATPPPRAPRDVPDLRSRCPRNRQATLACHPKRRKYLRRGGMGLPNRPVQQHALDDGHRHRLGRQFRNLPNYLPPKHVPADSEYSHLRNARRNLPNYYAPLHVPASPGRPPRPPTTRGSASDRPSSVPRAEPRPHLRPEPQRPVSVHPAAVRPRSKVRRSPVRSPSAAVPHHFPDSVGTTHRVRP